MSESVISYFMTLIHHAAQQIRIGLTVLTDYEKCRRYIFLFEDVEDSRCPIRIGAIVERQRDRTRMIARALDDIRRRNLFYVIGL